MASHLLHTMSTAPAYALVLDDHPLVGHGMAQYLQALRPDLAVRVATRWAEAQQCMHAQGCPQMLVADVWLAEGSILQTLSLVPAPANPKDLLGLLSIASTPAGRPQPRHAA